MLSNPQTTLCGLAIIVGAVLVIFGGTAGADVGKGIIATATAAGFILAKDHNQ